jgi:hypothetical protein
MAGLEGTSSKEDWKAGPKLSDLLDLPDNDPRKAMMGNGVAMAVFGPDGKFHKAHSALMAGIEDKGPRGEDGVRKCNVYDQFPNDTSTGEAKLPSIRTIPFTGGGYRGHGNSYNEFSIILTK